MFRYHFRYFCHFYFHLTLLEVHFCGNKESVHLMLLRYSYVALAKLSRLAKTIRF